MAMKTYFYILMLLFFLSLVGGFVLTFGPYTGYIHGVGGLIEFLLFLLLGWKVFGQPVQG
jgi:hypothetical protein